jgi:hypothetical protein
MFNTDKSVLFRSRIFLYRYISNILGNKCVIRVRR